MSGNIADIKTSAIVLRRTNYAEADRILNIITPVGKISAIAKGVRKARSKLAGGVEMFSLVELQIHQGRSRLGTVTSAKMIKYYGRILQDYDRMEVAGMILRRVATAAEGSDSEEWFEITRQCLAGLDEGAEVSLVESWFRLNLAKTMGEEMNLYRDGEGEALRADEKYDWDFYEKNFKKNNNGKYSADEIKLLRLLTSVDLATIRRIKVEQKTIDKVYDIIRVWEN